MGDIGERERDMVVLEKGKEEGREHAGIVRSQV